MMNDPLDLKLLMNQQQQEANVGYSKNCQDLCQEIYSDKQLYETNRLPQSKDQQIVQIVMNPNVQVIPQAAHQSVQSNVICSQNEQMMYKRNYAVEPQQMYTMAPASQYQIVSTNNRGATVQIQQQAPNHVDLGAYTGQTYLVTTGPDGTQQLQPIQDVTSIRQEPIVMTSSQVEMIQPNTSVHEATPPTTSSQPAAVQPVAIVKNGRGTNLKKNRPFKCDECTASFLEAAELEEHKGKHTGGGPFTCDDCHFTFMFQSHFRSHKTRCDKRRSNNAKTDTTYVFEAPVKHKFPKNYVKKNYNHQTMDNQVVTSVAARKTCKNIKFNPKNPTFKRNKKGCRIDRPFECDDCDASFQIESDLTNHKTKHTGDGPFTCETCKYVFLFKKLHDAHKRRCDKKFNINKNGLSNVTSTEVSTINNSSAPIASVSHDSPNYVTLNSNLDMHNSVVNVRGHVPEIVQMLPPHAMFDASSIPTGTIVQASTVGNDHLKYELVPATASDIQNMDVGQMVNLIKVKDPSQ